MLRAHLRLKRELGSGQIKSAGADQIAGSLLLEDGTRYDQTGKLQFSEVTVDQGTGAITLRAIFPNPTGLLLPGMFVQEEVEEGIRQTASSPRSKASPTTPRARPPPTKSS